MEFVLSKLDARLSGASELKTGLERLNGALPRANILMDKAEWWRFRDSNVARLLTELRDAVYDAEDVVAEFGYYEVQQQMEGKEGFWQHAAKYMQDFVRNRASKVTEIQARLDHTTTELQKAIAVMSSPGGSPTPHNKAFQRETSSFLTESVLGRENELEAVVGLMLQHHEAYGSSENHPKRRKTGGSISILPIVGIGGTGKTTLAQLIYNDERVKDHFDMRIWVCVSDQFDLKRITREIIESASRECRNNEVYYNTSNNVTNLDALQHVLKAKVESRRYLLVLDDVWHENSGDLESLCKPLRSGLRGSMILITTRSRKVAEILGNLDPMELGGLPDDIYWEFFKMCAFGSSDPKLFPELLHVGKKIVARLRGSPLAAKTLGSILRANMTPKQWRNISDSELWGIKRDDEGIFSALQLSYQYLPVHLKRCFVICSLYPKDYPLRLNVLSPIWMADGIITRDENVLIEDHNESSEYFQELKNRSFLIRGQYNNTYHVHDLMHDLAKSLSLDTCYCQEDNTWRLKDNNSIRHLSVFRKTNEFIENKISTCKKLRSLQFLNSYPNEIKLGPEILKHLFNQLPYLRILDLGHCNIDELPDDINKLKLLININLNTTRIKTIPNSICCLYNLQVINVERCPIQAFPNSFHKLTKLKLLAHTTEISSMIPGIGKLTSLEKLIEFKVLLKDGHRIEELKNMTQIRDCIKISNLENVTNPKDAAQACLNDKKYLSSLILSWSLGTRNNPQNEDFALYESTMESLEPHPNLENLFIENYGGITPPPWLQIEKLPNLCELGIKGCSNLKSLESWFIPYNSPPLQNLEIVNCANLLSLPLKWFGTSCLSRLKVTNCPLLSISSDLILPCSLSTFQLESCGELDKSLPECLENLLSLKCLELKNCKHVTCLPEHVTSHLRYLKLSNCAELRCLELNCVSTLEVVKIEKCTKLIQRDEAITSSNKIQRIRKLYIDNTSLLNLPFLRNPPYYLAQLKICNSDERTMFTGDLKGWLNGIENIEELILYDCFNLETLPEDLNSVKRIEIRNCFKIQGLPEIDLPLSLSIHCLGGCDPVLIAQVRQHKENNRLYR